MSAAIKKKTVIIVTGPTASGKTAFAVDLAQHLSTEIISADSRQCFKELNIGVARPSQKELDAVRHHFVASHSIHDKVSAATFEQYALEHASRLFGDHDTVVMTGGTGLYIKAFCEGMDKITEIPAANRETIVSEYEKKGLEWLQQEVQRKDPAFYAVGEIKNPRRLMRALEVFEATGKSIIDFREGKKTKRDFEIIKIGLELPRAELHRNINNRVEKMMETGLAEEVTSLLPYRNLNALQTVGYSEIFDHMGGKIGLEEAVERIKINTRQYARRQMTWLKKDKDVKWYAAADLPGIKKGIAELMSAVKS